MGTDRTSPRTSVLSLRNVRRIRDPGGCVRLPWMSGNAGDPPTGFRGRAPLVPRVQPVTPQREAA